jgi:hypothetical protein
MMPAIKKNKGKAMSANERVGFFLFVNARLFILTNIILVFLAALSFSQAHGAGNLISNPDFEDWDARRSLPLNWTRSSGLCEYSSESETGGSSMRIMAIDHRGQQGSFFQKDIPVRGEQRLHLHARVKTEGAGRAQALFRAFDAGGNDISPSTRWSGIIMNSPEWSDLHWNFTTSPETDRITIILTSRSAEEAPGSVWFDSVSVRREGVTLENDHLQLFIDPSGGGGRIQSLKLKDGTGYEYVYWDRPMSPGGFAADIIPAEKYPGVLRDVLYEVLEVDESGRRALLAYNLYP